MKNEWSSATVGDAFELVNGFAFKSKDFMNDGVPVIKIKNIKAGYFSEHELSYVDTVFLKSRSDKIARHDDLLISMSGNRHDGSPETWVGKVALFRKDSPYLINQRVGALRIKDTERFEPRYMSYLLSSWTYQSLFISIATSSGGQANLSPSQILSAPIDFPYIGTQREIAHILGTLDDKIELNRQMNETLEAMAQTLFKSWFVDFEPVIDNALAAGNEVPEPLQKRAAGRQALGNQRKPLPADIQALFPDRFVFTGKMGWVPEGWDVEPITRLADLNPEAWTNRIHPNVVEYVDLANVKNGRISEVASYHFEDAPSRARRVLAKNDTIIGTVRPGNRSFAFIQMTGLTGSTGFAVMRPKQVSNRSFIYLALTRNEVIEHFAHLADGAAYPAIRSEVVGNLITAIPEDSLLRAFDEFVYPWLSVIGLREQANQSLAKTRDTLQPKLISGELRIPDAEKLVAEAV